MSDAFLSDLARGLHVQAIGRLYTNGEITLNGHPAFRERHVIKGAPAGHYYCYAAKRFKGEAESIYLIYEDVDEAGQITIDAQYTDHLMGYPDGSILITDPPGYEVIEKRVWADTVVHDVIMEAYALPSGDLIPDFPINAPHSRALVIQSSECYDIYPIRRVRNGRLCGFQIACGRSV